jgi:hypothetical protein
MDHIATTADCALLATGKPAASYEEFVEAVLAQHRTTHLVDRVLGAVAAAVPPVVAYVNHGRWVVDCECGDAGVVDPAWPDRGFFCFGCYNIIHTGLPRRVTYPMDGVRYLVEGLLLLRPDPATRNWSPAETVGDLTIENIAHGLPVPRGA